MTKADEPKDLQQKKEESQQRHAVIERDVMRVLGRPADLHQVQVRQVGQDHYRVNVLIGTDTSCLRIAHSYFVTTDGDGNVLSSSPEIAKHY